MLKFENPVINGDGSQTRDFIYVKDIAEFIAGSILKNPVHKLFYLSSGKQASVNEITSVIKKITGFNAIIKHSASINGEVRDIFLDTSLAKEELDWSPRYDLVQGLKETVDWFRKNK
jgi:UDP-glucose 4-epimerase